jgi:hypothetical protein
MLLFQRESSLHTSLGPRSATRVSKWPPGRLVRYRSPDIARYSRRVIAHHEIHTCQKARIILFSRRCNTVAVSQAFTFQSSSYCASSPIASKTCLTLQSETEMLNVSVGSHSIRNVESARVSVPSYIRPLEESGSGSKHIWRTNLLATEPFWAGKSTTRHVKRREVLVSGRGLTGGGSGPLLSKELVPRI